MASINEQALAIIADCWCHPDTENLNPDINASARLAKKVEELLELLKLANERILTEYGKKDYEWTDKYEAWMKENHGVPTIS